MKTNALAPLLILLLFSLTLILSSCVTQLSEWENDQSAGINGGFEIVKSDLPVNWLVYTPKTCGEGDWDLRYDTSDVIEGKQSLCFDVRLCSDKGGRFSPGIAQEIKVKEGGRYKISFRIKNAGSDFKIKINAVNPLSEAKGIVMESKESIDKWRLYEYDYKMPKDMKRLCFELSTLKPGKFWIDELRVGEKDN